jgi:hypothetical protein
MLSHASPQKYIVLSEALGSSKTDQFADYFDKLPPAEKEVSRICITLGYTFSCNNPQKYQGLAQALDSKRPARARKTLEASG